MLQDNFACPRCKNSNWDKLFIREGGKKIHCCICNNLFNIDDGNINDEGEGDE